MKGFANNSMMRSDSFANSGEALAKISTYRAANGCKTGIKPPASARLTMIIENSPRASSVNPVLSEPTGDSPLRLPTINPAMSYSDERKQRRADRQPHRAAQRKWVDRKAEAEKEDRAEEIAERHDQFFHPFGVFCFAEYQSQEERADRFGDVNRFAESGKQEQTGENHDDENLVRRNVEEAIKKRRQPICREVSGRR